MSLYGEYLKEIYGTEILEDDAGFATYEFLEGGDCYLKDIYVVPSERKNQIASRYADAISEVARARGSKFIFGSVNLSIKDPTSSMKVLLAYGFKIDSMTQTGVILKKEL